MRAQKKGVTSLIRSKKALFQIALLIGAAAMICFGALRGEADTSNVQCYASAEEFDAALAALKGG